MVLFDYSCLGVIFLLGITGYFKGLLHQIAALTALVLAVVLSSWTARPLIALAKDNDIISEVNTYYLARIVTGAVVYFILNIFVWYFDSRISDAGWKRKPVNRFGGFLLGVIKGGVAVALILFALTYVHPDTLQSRVSFVHRSKLLAMTRQKNPFDHAVVFSNLKQAIHMAADPQSADKLAAFFKKKGIAVEKRMRDLKERRIQPLLEDGGLRKLLNKVNVFKEL